MIGKLRRNLRERGLAGTLERLARRIREGYTEERVVVNLKYLDEISEPRRLSGLRVEDLGPAELPDLRELTRRRGTPEDDRYFENSFAYGYNAFGAYLEERLVGYYWWVDAENPNPHPDVWKLGPDFELGPGDVYGSSMYLLDEARGNGRSAEFLFRVETALRDRGYSRLWGYVDKDNRPARWLYATRGYRDEWEMTNRRLVFVRWRRRAPIADAA